MLRWLAIQRVLLFGCNISYQTMTQFCKIPNPNFNIQINLIKIWRNLEENNAKILELQKIKI